MTKTQSGVNLWKVFEEMVQTNQTSASWLVHILKCEHNGNATFYSSSAMNDGKVARTAWFSAV